MAADVLGIHASLRYSGLHNQRYRLGRQVLAGNVAVAIYRPKNIAFMDASDSQPMKQGSDRAVCASRAWNEYGAPAPLLICFADR
jgi:hypothetical protein